MSKEIVYDQAVRARMLLGINKLADAVKTTLGPQGRNVMLQMSDCRLLSSNDGAAIAAEIDFEDPLEDMGAQILKEVAAKTNESAGDGTTTATILAQYLMQEGLRLVEAGADPLALKQGILQAAQVAAAAIKKLALPVQGKVALAQVASVSAKDTTIGAMVASALESVGAEGLVKIEESSSMQTCLEVAEGMHFERGFISPQMATDKNKLAAELIWPYILVTDSKITNPLAIAPLLEAVAEQGRPLLIIADTVEGAALATLIMNTQKATLCSVAVQAPAYGEGRLARLDDLALFTGGVFVSKERGYELCNTSLEMLGSAQSVVVTRTSTVIVGGGGDAEQMAERRSWLKSLIDHTDYDFAKQQLRERLAKFAGGVAVIKVGAASELEREEKRLRYEDALNAARAAAAEGILPGGGVGYLACAPAVKAYADTLEGDIKRGASLVLHALERPTRQIAVNAGCIEGAVINRIKELPRGTGFNAATGEYVNVVEAGVIDPAKVARLALLNAASAAAVLLTTEASVYAYQRD